LLCVCYSPLNRQSPILLVENGSVNTFPRQRRHTLDALFSMRSVFYQIKVGDYFYAELLYYEGESVNTSKIDIKRKTCDIRTWKNHLFLDISSTNIDALVSSLYQCVETSGIDIFYFYLNHFRNSVSNSSS
jgi:hypothetical protein